MTQEQYLRLQEFENHLFTAYKCNYVRMLTRNTSTILASIFEEYFNQKSRILNGCGHCVLSDLKRLGEEYYKYKDEIEKEKNIKVESQPEPIDVITTESEDKPKRRNNKVTKKDNKNK